MQRLTERECRCVMRKKWLKLSVWVLVSASLVLCPTLNIVADSGKGKNEDRDNKDKGGDNNKDGDKGNNKDRDKDRDHDEDKDRDHDDHDNDRDKVTICHKGQTLEIPRSALQAHLKHGDTLGPCNVTPNQNR